jgi:lysophospholipase L1-like esterase
MPIALVRTILLTGVLLMTAARAADPLPFAGKRLGFLGDSITDGHTHCILIEQSLRAAGVEPPLCTNFGVGGNRASDMLARLDRDVLPLKPDYVLLSVGVNDANTGVAPELYARQVAELLDRLAAARVQVIIMTPTPVIGQRGPVSQPLIEAYVATLKTYAQQRGLRLADLIEPFLVGAAADPTVYGGDGVHLGFAGYRIMARVVLDTLGYPQVPVVEQTTLAPLPGLITDWHLLPVIPGKPLPQGPVDLRPDATWTRLTLPLTTPVPGNWWLDQERQRGFAVNLPEPLGQAKELVGYTVIASPTARRAYLNPGAGLKALWLNGQAIYVAPGTSGWHVGRERVPVQLQAGDNVLHFTSSNVFFLSLTDTGTW